MWTKQWQRFIKSGEDLGSSKRARLHRHVYCRAWHLTQQAGAFPTSSFHWRATGQAVRMVESFLEHSHGARQTQVSFQPGNGTHWPSGIATEDFWSNLDVLYVPQYQVWFGVLLLSIILISNNQLGAWTRKFRRGKRNNSLATFQGKTKMKWKGSIQGNLGGKWSPGKRTWFDLDSSFFTGQLCSRETGS